MITSLVCGLVLAGAPKGLADAELITWAPKVTGISTLLPFFTRAGRGSLMVAPSSWRESAHPLLSFDVTRPESMTALGIAVNEGLSVTQRGVVTMSCHGLSDVKRFEAACRERLARFGEVFRTEATGVVTLGARDGLNRVQSAVVIKGKEACALEADGQTIEKLLPEASRALSKPLSGPALKGTLEPVSVLWPARPRGGFTALTLSTKADTLTIDTRAKALPFSALSGPGASPYGQLTAPGVATLRMRLPPAQLAGLLAQVLGGLPGGRTLGPASQGLAPSLTGNVAVVFSRVKLTSGLRTTAARFFASRLVLLAETNDVAAAQALVDALDPKALQFAEGTLTAGVQGSTVWLTNDKEVLAQVLPLLEKSAGQQRHGAEFDVDPKALAKALSAVPLLEVVQAPELSGFLVAASEVGPLLMLTQRVRGWLDSQPGGSHIGQLSWVLEPERADAGP